MASSAKYQAIYLHEVHLTNIFTWRCEWIKEEQLYALFYHFNLVATESTNYAGVNAFRFVFLTNSLKIKNILKMWLF